MRRKSFKLSLLTGASLFALAGVAGPIVLARDGARVHAENEVAETTNDGSTHSQNRQKACQVHERVINATMQRIAARGARHMAVFDRIAERVQNFAETKGKKPSNYDALVADVNAKKTAAQAALDEVKSDSVSFKCDGTDPKGAAEGFKSDLKAEIAALKDYKTAVKNLIVGVKSANASTAQDTSEGSEQ